MTDSYFATLFEQEINRAAEKVNGNYQHTREGLARMTPEQINSARRAGLLNDIMLGRK